MFKDYLSQIAVGIFAILWFVGGFYWLSTMPSKQVIVYDCSLSEISPDFPQDVRDACRKLRAQQSGRI